MAPDYKSYLKTQLIAEKQTVSYRHVARALKVHVNAAKCMLYEFYEQENKKRPGTIYATYLLAGTKKPVQDNSSSDANRNKTNGGVHSMASSPGPIGSSFLEPSQQTTQMDDAPAIVPVRTISLVREELVNEIRDQYEDITSIHIYSLSPGRLQDLVTLTDVGRDLFANHFVKDDPLIINKTYGIIQNSEVRRRKGKRPIIPDTPLPKFQPTKDDKPTLKDTKSTKAELKKEDSRPSSRESTPAPITSKTSLKRDGSSLFKAFAKQSANPKLKREDTDASTNASASATEEVSMADDDEGESEDEALFLDTNTKKAALSSSSKKRPSEVKKERDDKAAKLRKMMDSDDEDAAADSGATVPKVEDAAGITNDQPPATIPDATHQTGSPKDASPEDEEAAAADWSDSDAENKPKSTSTKTTTEADDGKPRRRRGKRKIMKKRTMKDEDGYLVTKEEAVWESFSEDEPEPVAKPAVRQQPAAKAKSSAGAAGGGVASQSSQEKKDGTVGKAGAKKKGPGGGGNIMSFFGKK